MDKIAKKIIRPSLSNPVMSSAGKVQYTTTAPAAEKTGTLFSPKTQELLGILAVLGALAPQAIDLFKTYKRIPRRKGIVGMVQKMGLKHRRNPVGNFVARNPELSTAGGVASLGIMGAELLDA